MSDGKKDVLEFPLEELEVPQAIAVMMQAASSRPTVDATCDEQENTYIQVDNERLQLLAEKLEARIEDEIEKAKAVRLEPTEEDEPNRFEDAEPSDTHLVMADGVVHQVIHKGVVFIKACNAGVYNDDANDIHTTCIKQWGHENMVHEDEFGNER